MDEKNTPKFLLFENEARSSLLDGVSKLAKAVGTTMGPGGLNVVIEQPERIPILTKDGVTVAKAVNLKDEMQNLGVQLVKEAAQGSAEIAGDGTTTATILAHSIFEKGLRAIHSGHNPVRVRSGIKDATNKIIDDLNSKSKKVSSDKEIVQVGMISANGEKEIGELLCLAMKKVGMDGVISVEEAKGFKTSLTTMEGLRLNRGFISPYFINDSAKGVCVLEKPLILLANKSIRSIKEILPLLEKVHQNQRPLLIVAEELEGEALNALVLNNTKGILKCCVIRAPEFGQGRIQTMEDLSVLLGTKVITSSDETSLANLQPSDLGTCAKVTISRNETIILGSNCEKEILEKRINDLRKALNSRIMSLEEEVVQKRRLARLAGGVALLRVGGSTEAELRERKDRVEDALHATRAAVSSGILPGGGTALLRSARNLSADEEKHEDWKVGFNIIKSACEAPIKQISKNAGQIPEIIVEKTMSYKSPKGYDARSETWVDLIESGIIDPALVVTSALQHAASAADNLLSVACAMTIEKK
tara:strand:- start:1549 stop:3144 length:1596 start_codon:yes stop_codon:yes gene_type:complete